MKARRPLTVSQLTAAATGPQAAATVVVTESTQSTNTDVAAAAAAGAPAWTVHVCDHQLAGRGRHGRPWVAPQYSQVTLSMLIRPPRAALGRLGMMPLAAGLAVVDTITEIVSALTRAAPATEQASAGTEWVVAPGVGRYRWAESTLQDAPGPGGAPENIDGTGAATGGQRAGYAAYAASAASVPAAGTSSQGLTDGLRRALWPTVKWPNDGLLSGRKVCGILAEAVNLGQDPAVVVGVGVNVSLTREELPVPHATSLELAAAESGIDLEVEREAVAAALIGHLRARLEQWISGDPAIKGAYRRACATIGTRVTVDLPGGDRLIGQAIGIGEDGCLIVSDDRGIRHEVSAGDVTHVRPA